ncbi:hypothetical protein ELQ88_31915 [Pseudomonas sp. MPC6]|nr:hypothetical protein ELQ88_31915 [Pseudomonas sp. MPC6]
MFSCSESEQKQLNTWVSFQSAEQPLLGQFSVSGNRLMIKIKPIPKVKFGTSSRIHPSRRSSTRLSFLNF